MGGAIIQTRRFRSGPIDIEILRTAVLLSLHANPRHLPAGADPLPVGVPSNIGVANVEGAAELFARQDHVHNHPAGLGVTLHHEPMWSKYSHDALATAANWDKTSLPTHDLWRIMFELMSDDQNDSALNLRINNISAVGSYGYVYHSHNAVANNGWATEIMVTHIGNDRAAAIGSPVIHGKRKGTDYLAVAGQWEASRWYEATPVLLYATFFVATADVSRLTLFPTAGTMSGDVDLWYKDW